MRTADVHRLADVGKRLRVRRRRIPELTTGEIERDDAAMLVANGESRELHRRRRIEMTQAADDHSPHRAALTLGTLESAERSFDGFAERQASLDVQDRAIANLD